MSCDVGEMTERLENEHVPTHVLIVKRMIRIMRSGKLIQKLNCHPLEVLNS